MRVDHARAGAAHRVGDVVGVEPAAQQARRGAAPPEGGGVAGEQLRVLPEVLRASHSRSSTARSSPPVVR